MVYVKQIKYDDASRVVFNFTLLLCMCLLRSIFLLYVVLWYKLFSKILPRVHVLLRTEVPKMWFTRRVCGSEQPFAAGNWSLDLLFKFFRCLQFF